MGKASSSKKVARAASTGGGRTSRGRTPWVWYLSMTAVVTLGVLGIVVSRNDLDQAAADPPVIGQDHWHAAYGIYLCDKFHPGLQDAPQANGRTDPYGIHSHGDGLIHIHPTSSVSAGKNAQLGVFLDDVNVKLTEDSLDMPDGPKLTSGKSKCGSKPGHVRVVEWETPEAEEEKRVKGDPNDLPLKQAQVITIAFVPEGTDIPKPPSAGDVTNPSDLPSDLGTPTSTPTPESQGASSTTPPSSAPDTSTSPTSAPASSTAPPP
jgi:hypothetical protein